MSLRFTRFTMRLDRNFENLRVECYWPRATDTIGYFKNKRKFENVLHTLINMTAKPFISWHTYHTLTDPPSFDKPLLSWHTHHTLTNPSYYDKPSLNWHHWQTLIRLTNPHKIDKPFISWHTFHTLTNPSYIGKPYISWQLPHKSYLEKPSLEC